MTDPANSLQIYVDYEDDALREQVEDGSTQALGWIRSIRADDVTMIGGEDGPGSREYLPSFFGGTLQCLTEALRGDRSHFTTGNGPMYVVLEPEGPDAIRFTFTYTNESVDTPEARRSFEPSVVVRTEPFVSEIRDTVEEFLHYVTQWNPSLAESSSAYRGLREDLETLEQAFEELESEY